MKLFVFPLRGLRSVFVLMIILGSSFLVHAQKPRLYISNWAFTDLHGINKIMYNYSNDMIDFLDIYDTVIYNQLAKKIPVSKLGYVLKNAIPEARPKGFLTADNYLLKDVKMYFFCSYDYKGRDFVLAEIPAAENQHLPENLRPVTDIYFSTAGYYMYDGFDVSGSKQYSKSYIKNKETQQNNFITYKNNADKQGIIDSSQYFKTIVPVPTLSKQEDLAIFTLNQGKREIDNSSKALFDALDEQKRNKEAAVLKQKKTDSLNTMINSLLSRIKMINDPMLELYRQGKMEQLLVKAGKWKTKSFNSNDTRPRPSNDIRGPVKLSFLESNALRFSYNNEKGGLDMAGDVTIYVKDDEPANALWGSRTLQETFTERMIKSPGGSNKFITAGDKHGVLMWDLSNTPLEFFNKKIGEYKSEAMADEFTIALTGDINIVYMWMKTPHFDEMIFMQADVFEMYLQMAQLVKNRDGL